MTISDEKLSAYVDGELSSAERAEVERALRHDAALRGRVERQRSLKKELSATYDALLDGPAPDGLIDKIRARPIGTPPAWGGQIIALRRRVAGAARGVSVAQGVALAASLAVGVFVGASLLGGDQVAPGGAMVVADAEGLSAQGALAVALTEQLSGEPGAEGVRVMLSFRDEGGALCRSFVAPAAELSGLACRAGDAWRVRMALAEAPQTVGSDGFRPAAGGLPAALVGAIDAAIVGEPLDVADERAARAGGWARQ